MAELEHPQLEWSKMVRAVFVLKLSLLVNNNRTDLDSILSLELVI